MPALTEDPLVDLARRAVGGDRLAVDSLVRALADDVHRLALRMTACPPDAEDAAQEILIKVVTRLDSFRGASSLRTWVYRIAIHHLLDRRKSSVERLGLTFETFAADLLDGLSADPDPDPDAAEQVKRGCTLAMLTCLDRAHRVAYLLAEVFDLSPAEAAAVANTDEATHRQRASRARRKVEAFTLSYCGLVGSEAPCSCDRRVARAHELGRITRRDDATRAAPGVLAMERLHTTAGLMRSRDRERAPERILEAIAEATAPGRPLGA